ncbi:hypothetical protein [Absidia glauca]|uniref:Uncharacterized protein n=1 Tax=Absidia glauca TaxID=4829 RepID=A0A163JU88_ABSGL|nr:hypothetical protein [Absidia glauca]
MKALSFYLLFTAMALMEIVSVNGYNGDMLFFLDRRGRLEIERFRDCYNLEMTTPYAATCPTDCQFYTDIACKTPVPGPPVHLVDYGRKTKKYAKGSVKCKPAY